MKKPKVPTHKEHMAMLDGILAHEAKPVTDDKRIAVQRGPAWSPSLAREALRRELVRFCATQSTEMLRTEIRLRLAIQGFDVISGSIATCDVCAEPSTFATWTATHLKRRPYLVKRDGVVLMELVELEMTAEPVPMTTPPRVAHFEENVPGPREPLIVEAPTLLSRLQGQLNGKPSGKPNGKGKVRKGQA